MQTEDDDLRLVATRTTTAPAKTAAVSDAIAAAGPDDGFDAATPAVESVAWHCANLERRAESLRQAKKSRVVTDVEEAQRCLQDAVDAARDAGFGWMQIGDAVGLCRGNAYQRFRRSRRSAP